MWQIENNTPFGARGAFARDRQGAETWLVAVKAAYLIKPDGTIGMGEQTDPVPAPEYLGAPGRSSLKYDSDLELTKPGTDIILHGHAYAPNDKPAAKTGVALKLGPINKMLEVTGDRYWEEAMGGTRLSAPTAFEKIPLVYENTFGGTDDAKMQNNAPHAFDENPVGTGFALKKSHLQGRKAPNIRYFGNGDGRPACFGPVPREWMPRAQYSGTYDKQWRRDRCPLVPADLDDRFYRCAPWDQQIAGYLKGGEIVEILGMSPYGALKFKLPAPHLTFKTVIGRHVKAHRADLHTVILEPDIPGFSMVWHTALNCHNQDHQLEKTIIS